MMQQSWARILSLCTIFCAFSAYASKLPYQFRLQIVDPAHPKKILNETTLIPLELNQTANGFYAYGRYHSASATTGFERRGTIVFFMAQDSSDQIALFWIMDIYRHHVMQRRIEGTGGHCHISMKSEGLEKADIKVLAYDDPPPSDHYNLGSAANGTVQWRWSPCCTDGMALGYFPVKKPFRVSVRLDDLVGPDTLRALTYAKDGKESPGVARSSVPHPPARIALEQGLAGLVNGTGPFTLRLIYGPPKAGVDVMAIIITPIALILLGVALTIIIYTRVRKMRQKRQSGRLAQQESMQDSLLGAEEGRADEAKKAGKPAKGGGYIIQGSGGGGLVAVDWGKLGPVSNTGAPVPEGRTKGFTSASVNSDGTQPIPTAKPARQCTLL